MKRLLLFALTLLSLGTLAQEIHFDFSVTTSTGYQIYYRILDADARQVELTYPCRNNDNYWYGYEQPEGKLMLTETVSHNGVDYTVVGIGDHAFCGCNGLRGELELPHLLVSIGAAAFKGCSNFNGNLVIPASVTQIDDEAFLDCSSFSGKLFLNDSIQRIGDEAFMNCSFLGMVSFPATLTSIGQRAFKGCDRLAGLNSKMSPPPTTASDAFDDIPTWITVNVPYNTADAYKNAPGWSRFASKITEKSIWSGNATPWTHGQGSPDDPYLIESAENLAWLAKSVNERQDLEVTYDYDGNPYYHFYDLKAYQDTCFRLVIDIDLGGNTGLLWIPIGNRIYVDPNDYDGEIGTQHYTLGLNAVYYYFAYFSGRFDGNGHSIDNLTCHNNNRSNTPIHYGLFGRTSLASLTNLSIQNINLAISYGNSLGGVVGEAINTSISDCFVSGTIRGGVIGGIVGNAQSCRIENCISQADLLDANTKGGIVGQLVCDTLNNQWDGVFRCGYLGRINSGFLVGGIVGSCKGAVDGLGVARVENCFCRGVIKKHLVAPNKGVIYVEDIDTQLGGIVGLAAAIDTLRILNCYSNDSIIGIGYNTDHAKYYVGGVLANAAASTTLYIKNCYHVGPLTSKTYKGGILPQNTNMTVVRNCFFESGCAPDNGFGLPLDRQEMKTESFLNRLNNGSSAFMMDTEPFPNDGFPVLGTDGLIFNHADWYYEITNPDGSVTYQYLQCVGDTSIQEKRPKVIVRSNTHYDKRFQTHVTHEYLYEENGVVFWWNKTLGKFTVLYDFGAEVGDEWQIEVGDQAITMHVYEVESQIIDGIPYKRLTIGDAEGFFSGVVVSNIGHLASFFPERLMSKTTNYQVNGLRCYWLDGDLLLKLGSNDCDAIYTQNHNSLPEIPIPHSASRIPHFTLYPNPTPRNTGITLSRNNVNNVNNANNVTSSSFLITSPLGQPLLTGPILSNPFQIDLSSLPKGLYFITIGTQTEKLIIQ